MGSLLSASILQCRRKHPRRTQEGTMLQRRWHSFFAISFSINSITLGLASAGFSRGGASVIPHFFPTSRGASAIRCLNKQKTVVSSYLLADPWFVSVLVTCTRPIIPPGSISRLPEYIDVGVIATAETCRLVGLARRGAG